MKEYYTVNEVCTILSLSRSTIIRYIKSGRLKAIKHTKYYFIPQSELDKFLVISELKARGLTTKQAERYLELAMKEVTEKEDAFTDLMSEICRANVKKQEEEYRGNKQIN